MKIEEKIQFESFNPKSYILYEDIKTILNMKDLKEVYYIFGSMKDEAYDILKDIMCEVYNKGAKYNFVIGIDRRNISRAVMESMFAIADNFYVYNNNVQDDFNAKIYIFKFEKEVIVILPSSNLTLKGITNGYANVTKIIFDLEKDLDAYNEFMFGIKEYIYPDERIFKKVNPKIIEELELKRELLIRRDDESLPSIDEYLKKTASMKSKISNEEFEEKIKSKLDNIVKDFDIEMEDDE